MPRFYFDVSEDDHVTREDAGLPLESLNAAEEEAIRAAAGISHDSLPRRQASEIVVQVGFVALTCQATGSGR
jgi:hypothetical protein